MDAASTPRPRDVDAREFRAELDAELRESDLVLVDFYTAGCAMCRAIEPVLGSVARATGVPILTVNPKDDPSLVADLRIRSVPSLVLFDADGEVARLAEGFVGAERIVDLIETNR